MSIMKKVLDNEQCDIFEFNSSKHDIVEIVLIEKAKIKDIKTEKEYFNDTFLLITNRKGVTRILDLKSHIDITNLFKNFEIIVGAKTKEKPIFIGQ